MPSSLCPVVDVLSAILPCLVCRLWPSGFIAPSPCGVMLWSACLQPRRQIGAVRTVASSRVLHEDILTRLHDYRGVTACRSMTAFRPLLRLSLPGAVCDFRLQYGFCIGSKAKFVAVNRMRSNAYLNKIPDIAAVCHPPRQHMSELCLACLLLRMDASASKEETAHRSTAKSLGSTSICTRYALICVVWLQICDPGLFLVALSAASPRWCSDRQTETKLSVWLDELDQAEREQNDTIQKNAERRPPQVVSRSRRTRIGVHLR